MVYYKDVVYLSLFFNINNTHPCLRKLTIKNRIIRIVRLSSQTSSGISLFRRGGYVVIDVSVNSSIYFSEIVTGVKRRVSLVVQKLHTFPEHPSSLLFLVEFVLCFVDHCPLSLGLCIVLSFDLQLLIAPSWHL